MDAGEILAKLSDRDDPFEIIKRKLSDDEVARVAHMLEPIDLHRSRNEYADAETAPSAGVGQMNRPWSIRFT